VIFVPLAELQTSLSKQDEKERQGAPHGGSQAAGVSPHRQKKPTENVDHAR
jgi:hypothetical protein